MEHAVKQKAVSLRLEGKTYKEILEEIPVAKSTLSLWLRSVGLSSTQVQRITKKRIDSACRGAEARKERRMREIALCASQGREDVGLLTKRELWLIGIALHWAEGTKQNARSPSAGVMFGNTDARMMQVYLEWLAMAGVRNADIYYELYCHATRKSEAAAFREWWERRLGLATGEIQKIYFKSGNPNTKRSNSGDLYRGLLRIRVRSSTSLNRKLQGWAEGIAASVQH